MTTYQGDLIVGSGLSHVDGLPANGVARWNGTQWQALGHGLTARVGSPYVTASRIYQGDLLVGGDFDSAGGAPAAGVARWNGTAWSAMGSLAEVQDFEEYGGALHAATWNGLYRWTGSSWLLIGAGSFEDLVLFNGQLVAVGLFNVPGGSAEVAAWNGTGWTVLATDTDWAAYCGEVYDNQLYVGGEFSAINGVAARGIARWTGSTWQPLTAGLGANVVRDMQATDTGLALVGHLSAAAGQPAGNVVMWDGTTWTTLGDLNSGGDNAYCAHLWNGALTVGGLFDAAGSGVYRGLAQWNGAAWTAVGPLTQRGMDGQINRLAVWNGLLVAAGYFLSAGSTATPHGMASFDGSDWTAIPTALHAPVPALPSVTALGVLGDDLLLGGRFDQINGQPMSCVAAWNGTAWRAFGDGLNLEVMAFTTWNGSLIAAGNFTASGARTLARTARWDGSAWQPMGNGMNATVNALRVIGGELYAGGTFTASGATPISCVARWDGVDWQPVGGGTNGRVNALEDYGGQLVAAGTFTTAGGNPARNIARWNGTSWEPLGDGFTVSVTTLKAYGGELYAARVADSFLAAGADATTSVSDRVARWNGTDWRPLGSGLTLGLRFPFGPSAGTMAVFGGHLYLGGDFLAAGFKPAQYIARWELPGPSAVPEAPPVAHLLMASPNPTNGAVMFRVSLPVIERVSLDIVDVQGRLVRSLGARTLPAGDARWPWDGYDATGQPVAPGVYFGRLLRPGHVAAVRIVRVP